MKKRIKRQTWFVLAFLLVAGAFALTLELSLVRGDSMEPSYSNGQLVLVRKIWSVGAIKQGDVVLLRQGDDVIIKRVFRLPGEGIDNGFPYLLAFSRENRLLRRYRPVVAPDKTVRYVVPDGEIVVLGDNLRASQDSRDFGPVPMRDILGLAVRAPQAPLR